MRRDEEGGQSDSVSGDSDSDESGSESETGSEAREARPQRHNTQQQQPGRLPKKVPEFQMSSKQEEFSDCLISKRKEITADGV